MANKLYEYVIKLVDQATSPMRKIAGAAEKVDNKLNGLINKAGKVAVALGLAFGISQLSAYGQEAIQTGAKVENMTNAIVYAAGSAQEGAKNLQFLSDISERLGINQMSATDGFRTLSGAMMGSGITAQQIRDIFTNVSTAVSAMGLSGEDANGTFLALGQIMSKGKVSAEELRGQIGERIPGAFNIAARAMGMTTQQLDKLMQKGDLASKDFIIPFANELKKQFEGALPKAVNSLQANLNRLDNGILALKTSFVQEFMPEILSTVKILNAQFLPALKNAFGYLRSAITFIKEHEKGLKALAVGLTVAAVAYGLLTTAAKVNAWWMGASTAAFYAQYVAAGGLTAAWEVLNAVMYANPIGVVVLALAALAAGIYYAWQKCETFRAAIMALWEVTKNYYTGLYHLIHGLATFNFEEMKNAFHQLGVGTAESWKKGWQDGIDNFRLDGVAKKLAGNQYGAADFGVNSWQKLDGKPINSSGGAADGKSKADLDKVSDGGRRQQIVNVTIQKMQVGDKVEFKSFKESVNQIEGDITELMIRALNGAVASLNQ